MGRAKRVIRLGSRGSQLALWQAEHIRSEIERETGRPVEITKIKTTGDMILDVPLSRVGGKGLFVKEIEEALLSGRIDLAVHSMKDVPTDLPDRLGIVAITRREDPRDAFLSVKYRRLEELPQGGRVGTSSLRRQTQLLGLRPDLRIESLRGNLDTRIRKMEEGLFDAVILAAAGIRRLGWEAKITQYLPPELSLPAIGQGALGIEIRTDDLETREAVSFLNHRDTAYAVRAERGFLKRLEGGCQVPIASFGRTDGEAIVLEGLVGRPDGSQILRAGARGTVADPEGLGVSLAEELLRRGAKEILDEVYRKAGPERG
ncbi:MAG: hydroxymethylbilane synthase [Deltaproteobacteria bacterium GWC2_65_14]|nr:MAG: hydroxymethylbilane synthase [Deltaproteobacteria bacterium GWC2_65_14]